MIARTYIITVAHGRATLRTDGGNALATIERELSAPDLVALLAAPAAAPLPTPPAPRRWLERLLLVAVTAVLVYRFGPTIVWFLTDTSDHHLNFYYGTRP